MTTHKTKQLSVIRHALARLEEGQQALAKQESVRNSNRLWAVLVILSSLFSLGWALAVTGWGPALLAVPALWFGCVYFKDNRADPTKAEFLRRGQEALVDARLVEAQLELEAAEEDEP